LLDNSRQTIYAATEFVGGEMNGDKWIRQGDFKAMMVSVVWGGTGTWQLFDLAKDPGEVKDLSGLTPEKLESLTAAWDEYATEVGVVPRE
jgi:arylsulfatase A-like enzyme